MKAESAASPEYSVCLVYGHLDLKCSPVFLRLKGLVLRLGLMYGAGTLKR